jgi:hypothetical protein
MTDPTRRPEFLCPDCATDNMVTTSLPGYCEDGSNGAMVVVVHGVTCPLFAALPDGAWHQPDDYGIVVHLSAAGQPDPPEPR